MTPLWTLSFSLKTTLKSSEDWKYPTVTRCSASPVFIGMISCSLVSLVMRIWLLGAGGGSDMGHCWAGLASSYTFDERYGDGPSRTTAGQRGSSGVQLTLLLHQSNHAAFRTSFFVHHPQILECISICKENNSSKL